MPQISLYVKEPDYKLICKAAKQSQQSISSWVMSIIKPAINNTYSQEFIDIFGSISEDDLICPDGLSLSHDAQREKI